MYLLIPIIGLSLNACIQVLIFRYISGLGLLKSEYLGFLIGLLVVLALEFRAVFSGIFIVNLITYILLSYCYFHFVNLGETARRIRILRELYDSKTGLSMEGLLERYNAKEIVEKRINRLISNGQIIYKEDRYYIGNPLMLYIAKIITAMKIVLLGKRNKFD